MPGKKVKVKTQKKEKKTFHLHPVKEFLRKKSPEQILLLKKFLKTGYRPSGLTDNTIIGFTKVGLDYKEAANRKRKKPYKAQFSYEQKQEINRQARELVEFFYPGKPRMWQYKLIEKIKKNTELIQRKHVNFWINQKDFGLTIESGKMYLNALDPKNRKKDLQKDSAFVGYSQNPPKKIVLSPDWTAKKLYYTTPVHEAMHFLNGFNEYKTQLFEFYYSLKRGITSENYLKKYRIKQKHDMDDPRKRAINKAIKLYQLGKEKGNWQESDNLVRKEIDLKFKA